jgi:hypothetical protein
MNFLIEQIPVLLNQIILQNNKFNFTIQLKIQKFEALNKKSSAQTQF